ncbi:hypothetical protein NDU88_004571 [Pleurodeles waltl]|uniref:Uncharacterized protein n=1 Tax=Pleurodeles waltl TaxID=8319 RepID=A0AAV7VGN9_PLEWA|nr:hypothetical protein NDU88_004571 [Pleurodeles waltl]
MSDDYVQRALALLEKAGRMDLINVEALGTLRLAQKASNGVTAAVFTCLPLRSGPKVAQVMRGRQIPAGIRGLGEEAEFDVDRPGDRDHDRAGNVGVITPPVGNELDSSKGGEQQKKMAKVGGGGEETLAPDLARGSLVPISKKWPTMLEWSTSKSEGGSEVEGLALQKAIDSAPP